MELGTWLLEAISGGGLATVLVVAGLVFLATQVWPFYRDKVYPDWQLRQERIIQARFAEADAQRSMAVAQIQLAGAIECVSMPAPDGAQQPASGQGAVRDLFRTED